MIAGAFYTYIHRRADDGRVFYVGKGRGKRAHASNGRNGWWRAVAKKHGLKICIVAEWESEQEAFAHEVQLIRKYREAGVQLCNMTDGGEGASGHKHSDETKEIISAKLLGKKRTHEQNKRNSEARAGKPIPAAVAEKISAANKGQKRSDQSRANISAGMIGKTISEDHRLKISEGNKGQVRSKEFRVKISAALTGRPVSAETRKKISIANQAKQMSESAKQKISKALTGRKHPKETMEKLIRIARSPARRAKQSKAMKGKPWTEARRAAHERRAAL